MTLFFTKILLFLIFVAPFQLVFAEKLTVVSDYWCPYNCEPDAREEGFGVDLLRAIFEPEGIKVEYRLLPYALAVLAVEKSEYNAVIGAFKSESQSLLYPKNSFSKSVNCFFTAPSNSWEFKGVSSIKNTRIGVIKGYSYGREFDSYLTKKTENIYWADGEHPLQQLKNKLKKEEVETIIEDKNVFLYHSKQAFPDTGYKNVGCIPSANVYIAFAPNNPKSKNYIELFDSKMEQFRADGTLKRIISRYQ